MERTAIYEQLIERVKWMRANEESIIFETYEMSLYEKVSALTDAVFADMVSLSRAKRLLENHIGSLKPTEGTIRF